jgi:hypothetical protein
MHRVLLITESSKRGGTFQFHHLLMELLKYFMSNFLIIILKETWNNFRRASNTLLDKRHIYVHTNSSLLS